MSINQGIGTNKLIPLPSRVSPHASGAGDTWNRDSVADRTSSLGSFLETLPRIPARCVFVMVSVRKILISGIPPGSPLVVERSVTRGKIENDQNSKKISCGVYNSPIPNHRKKGGTWGGGTRGIPRLVKRCKQLIISASFARYNGLVVQKVVLKSLL